MTHQVLKGFLLALTMSGLFAAANLHAQTRGVFRSDSFYLTTANDDEMSPSDELGASKQTANCGCAANSACGKSCGCKSRSCKGSGCGSSAPTCCPDGYEIDCGEPWTLQRCDNIWGITYGGWFQAGITGNDQGVRTNEGNFPVFFNDKSNGGQINQAWAYVERATDTGGCGWDFGFRFDYVFGTDGQDVQAFGDIGWDTEWDASTEYGSAIPQLYATVAYNDLTVKLGHFFTIIGYEVVPAPDNFFYSHALTTIWGEPFTHTGALGEYAYNDRVTIYGGYVQGWDSGFNNANNAHMFIGGISLGLTDNLSVTYATTSGDFGNGAVANQGQLYMHSLVVDWSITDKFNYVLAHDLGTNDLAGNANIDWYSVSNNFFYDINCCWAAGVRVEWFNDVDGGRLGIAGDYYEATAGLNYKPHANLTIRPEVRYDWFNGAGLPYANNTSSDLLTYGVDLVLTF